MRIIHVFAAALRRAVLPTRTSRVPMRLAWSRISDLLFCLTWQTLAYFVASKRSFRFSPLLRSPPLHPRVLLPPLLPPLPMLPFFLKAFRSVRIFRFCRFPRCFHCIRPFRFSRRGRCCLFCRSCRFYRVFRFIRFRLCCRFC